MVTEEATRLAGRGHSVTVLTRRLGSATGLEKRGNLTLHRYRVNSSGLLFHLTEFVAGFLETRRSLKDFDLVHIHLPLVGAGASLAAFQKVPLVASFYSIWALEWEQEKQFESGRSELSGVQKVFRRYLLSLDRLVSRRVQRAIVLSEFGKTLCVEHLKTPVELLRILPGAVDVEAFSPRHRDEAWRCSKVPAGEVLLFTARRLVARTGVDRLIQACSILRQRGVRFRLMIAGDGDQRGALTSLCEALNLEKDVEFLGVVPDEELRRLLASSDLFILPTLAYEGFGMATVEALASGTPVLGTPVGATPEVLSPLGDRWLADSSDPVDLANAAEALIRDRNGLAEARETCVLYARKRFGWDGHMEQLEEVYRSVLR